MAILDAAIAATRFGLGARPGELAAIGADARGWLAAQVVRPQAFAIKAPGLPTTAQAAKAFEDYRDARTMRREARGAPQTPSNDPPPAASLRLLADVNAIAQREAEARIAAAVATGEGFSERLALFWANHFTVAATKAVSIPFVGAFEREAVRVRLTGRFEDLLLAASRHPGMLLYLDQAQSIGPNSIAGRRREAGLNENLAREILELHTLGAQSGYTQADVTEFAKALTGWTVIGPRTQRFAPPGAQPGEAAFIAVLHEPGARTVLGKRYAEGGADQATAILKDLAAHPATARRVATKLARHLTQDQPSEDSIARLERVFRDTQGDLPSLHRALVDLPDAWRAEPRKFKTPNEFLISALRLLGMEEAPGGRALGGAFLLLGQPPYRAPSPKGWPDDAESWAAPDALIKRLEWSQALAERVGARARPEAMAEAALGPLLTARTREGVRRAESAQQGLALALMAPEFQRR